MLFNGRPISCEINEVADPISRYWTGRVFVFFVGILVFIGGVLPLLGVQGDAKYQAKAGKDVF